MYGDFCARMLEKALEDVAPDFVYLSEPISDNRGPLISPAMFYNIVIGVIAALQTFENVYILRTPLTSDSLQSAAFLLYSRTFSELHIGEGAAMSWILVVIIVTLTILQFRFSRSWVHYEA